MSGLEILFIQVTEKSYICALVWSYLPDPISPYGSRNCRYRCLCATYIKLSIKQPVLFNTSLVFLSIPTIAPALPYPVHAYVGQAFPVRALVGKGITLNLQLYHPPSTQPPSTLRVVVAVDGFGLVCLVLLFCFLTLTSLILKYPLDI